MTTPTSTDLRRFLGRLALFLLPVAGLAVIEQIALRHGWLTFRVWEQLVALPPAVHPDPPFPGPFYPRQTVTRTEQGDLGFHTDLATRRRVTWQTDRYGYRNEDSDVPPTVVIVGDSMIAGSSLDQSQLLSTLLTRELGVRVVNLAPASVPAVFAEHRFLEHRPKLVLEGMVERHIMEKDHSCEAPLPQPKEYSDEGAFNQLALWWWVTSDRQMKRPLLRWAKSNLSGGRIISSLGRDRRTLFHRGDKVHNANLATLGPGAQNLARCRDLLAAKGIAYLPFIIPDKETIYWELLPSGKKPATYRRVLESLARAGLPVVDLEAAFSADRQRTAEPLYPYDESHWSPRTVALASRVLADTLKGMGVLDSVPGRDGTVP
jgi:alginate O-acetyltransferase complex protein AlgJ